MKHSEGTFKGYQELPLYYQKWQADSSKAVIAIVHGFGEHSGRYKHVVDRVLPEGFSVYGFDHRGHGKSPGKRGHINEWVEFIDDVKNFLSLVQDKNKDLPIFLMGHSMGGLIVLNYILSNPNGIKGVIASAPLLAQPGISPVLLFISRIMSKVWPGFSIDTKLNVNFISRDPKEIETYKNDPLVHSMASARFGTELVGAQQQTLDQAENFKLPLLLYHGEADQLVPKEGSKTFFEKCGSADKEFHLYPKGRHESHNDIDRETVLNNLLKWLEKHL